MSSSQPIVCVQSEVTEFAAELSEFSLSKQYSQNSIPPVSQRNMNLFARVPDREDR